MAPSPPPWIRAWQENEFFIIASLGTVINLIQAPVFESFTGFVLQILDSDIGDILKKGFLLKKVILILYSPIHLNDHLV